MPKTRAPYSPELREQMVALARSGRTPDSLVAGKDDPVARPAGGQPNFIRRSEGQHSACMFDYCPRFAHASEQQA